MRHTTVEQPRTAKAVLALVMAGAFMLAGCSSPPDAGPTPPPASAPTATESVPTTAPPPTTPAVYKPATAQGPAENVPVPVLPEKAKEFSKEGLIAFAEYWYSTLGYAYETGDVSPLQEVSDAQCPSCQRVKDRVEQQYRDGGWLVGGLMIVHDSRSNFNEMTDGTYQAVLTIQQTKVTAFAPDGSVQSEPRQTIARPDIVIAIHGDGQWTAINAEHLTKE